MAFSKLALAALLGLAIANPLPEAEPQLTLPPLIPSIPGVTEPIASNAPPLPIAQAPTPALPSPPYTPSNLRPKKIAFIFTGAGDKQHADFLASYSLDDDTFGTLLRVVDLPTSGNSPHHLGASADGKYLWGGGLLSLLKTQDTGFYFDVSDPYEPKFVKSDRAALASIADEVVAKPDGGFYFTYMGSAAGTSPGRLIETDRNNNIIHQWPEDTAGLLNVLGQQFSPHGLAIDFDKKVLLTSDFVIPASVLKPTTGVAYADTLRLWDLSSHTIISTITIPNGQGIQDVKFIPGNPESAALATAVGLGQVWIIYPFRKDASGKQGTAEFFFDLGEKARKTIAIFSAISKDGKYAYFTQTLNPHVTAVDISDLKNPKRLNSADELQPVEGPHYLKISPDQKHVLITDYFVQAGDISILNTPGTFKAQYLDIQPDGNIRFNRSIDLPRDFANRGGARPHSSVIYDLTDPFHPKFG